MRGSSYGAWIYLKKQTKYRLSYMSHLMTKPTKLSVRPAKIEISLGIRPVWSESLLSTWRKLGSLYSYLLSAQPRLWSDWADAQADLRLCYVHISFCWFCCEATHIFFKNKHSLSKTALHNTIREKGSQMPPKLALGFLNLSNFVSRTYFFLSSLYCNITRVLIRINIIAQ